IDDEGIPPRSLELELTESVLLESTEQNRKKVAALRELGCLVAIDDFGTGFATLNYIRRFPMDVLKIDRTFIRNLPYDAENMAITNAITALGNSLGLEVVAEGVETEEEFEYLRSIGCPVVQGYLFSAAMDAETLVRWEQERRAKKTASSAPSTEPI
ncbi:MAG: EAL domain-containing protein, partial [Sandaracinaceae bacterium]|nr:EAL domain-containing protein [Sandaracinaceae bacterium]